MRATSGLGLLTGRWLAQNGACGLVLASRGGALSRDTKVDWLAIQAREATTALVRCDTGEATHILRLVTLAPSLAGMWHAAGVLSDALLPEQDVPGLSCSNDVPCRVRDLWAKKALGTFHGSFTAKAVASHDCAFLLIEQA